MKTLENVHFQWLWSSTDYKMNGIHFKWIAAGPFTRRWGQHKWHNSSQPAQWLIFILKLFLTLIATFSSPLNKSIIFNLLHTCFIYIGTFTVFNLCSTLNCFYHCYLHCPLQVWPLQSLFFNPESTPIKLHLKFTCPSCHQDFKT